jgi:hypothetical protein
MTNLVNWVPLVAAAIAVIPPGALFFFVYGRYDGAFRDNVVFLYFLGGLLVGAFLGLFTLFLYGTNALLVQVVGLSLLYPITIVLAVNRRKWQGERHAVFNGGAVGIGAAVMMGMSLLFVVLNSPLHDAQAAADAAQAALNQTDAQGNRITHAPTLDSAPFAFQPAVDGQGILLALALGGLFFGLGLLAGDAVRRRRQIGVALLGTAIVLPTSVFLEEWFRTRAWLWVVLLAGYGVILAALAERRLMPQGLTDEARRERRRARRRAS